MDNPVLVILQMLVDGYVLHQPYNRQCELTLPENPDVQAACTSGVWSVFVELTEDGAVLEIEEYGNFCKVHLQEPGCVPQWCVVHDGNAAALKWRVPAPMPLIRTDLH